MENTGAKCPACGSTNTYVRQRGYSPALGILGAVAFFFIFIAWTILSSDYLHADEAVKTVVFLEFRSRLVWPVAAGLLCGLIGRNELRAKCRDCGKRFRP